ncbi:MAG: CAAX prenyl protease-related protein [Nitrospirae bacterium]|nr:CAAX prenyl protease-related protein [Nitrospirota bacterium]
MSADSNTLFAKWNDLYARDWFPRVFPFAVFMAFIAIESTLPSGFYMIYIVKSIVVGLILLHFRKKYTEINISVSFKDLCVSVIVGVAVFILWINMTWDFAVIGEPRNNDPYATLGKGILYPAIFFRVFGSSVVVPVMEELFWRSFLIRWLDNKNFLAVPLGAFSLQSFAVTVLLFGSEHNLWLAGIMAGVLYNLLLYYRRNIFLCIIAHGVTNFVLGVYVLSTERWMFW